VKTEAVTLPAQPPTLDRRVRRSRLALLRASIALVAERGTTAVTVSDIAEAADVSRQLVYQQFSDRDTLLLEAARDLAERELLPRITNPAEGDTPMLSVAEHFAEHRSFYRPMLTGPCAFGLDGLLCGMLGPYNQQIVQLMSPKPLAPQLAADLTAFVTGGFAQVINAWVIDGPDPLDPPAFAERLMRLIPLLIR
jgi:AcrR family transcriptional regulator